MGEPSRLVCTASTSEASVLAAVLRQNIIPRVVWMAKNRNGIQIVAETPECSFSERGDRTSHAGDEVIV